MDAWLLRQFPGRTLDELDGMDWGRYLRAMEADHMQTIEDKRIAQINGDIKADAITPEEWEQIKANDLLD